MTPESLLIIDRHGSHWAVTPDQGEEGSFLRALCEHILLLDGLLREQSAEGRAEIENSNLVIRVAIECLPTIVNSGLHGDLIEVTDPEEFARELLRELQSEAEDGTTIVHKMFDDAILRAYENGAEGCREYNPVISELESEFAG